MVIEVTRMFVIDVPFLCSFDSSRCRCWIVSRLVRDARWSVLSCFPVRSHEDTVAHQRPRHHLSAYDTAYSQPEGQHGCFTPAPGGVRLQVSSVETYLSRSKMEARLTAGTASRSTAGMRTTLDRNAFTRESRGLSRILSRLS